MGSMGDSAELAQHNRHILRGSAPKPSSAAAILDINFYIYHHHEPFRARPRNANNENHESCIPDKYFEPRLRGSCDWYCCNCGDGPLNLELCEGCGSCSHLRCSDCAVEPRK